MQGTLELNATSGDVTVGVRKGTLVWLDLTTVSGRTTSDLTPDDPDASGGGKPLAVRVRTVSGNITVTTSAADSAAA